MCIRDRYNASASTALTDFGRAKQLNFNGNIAQLVRLKSAGSLSGIAWLSTLCSPYIASVAAGPYSYAEVLPSYCLLYTSNAAAERSSVDLGGRRIIKKKKYRCMVCTESLITVDEHSRHTLIYEEYMYL